MFTRHQRKLRLFHSLADIAMVAGGFEAAYLLRSHLPLQHNFYFDPPIKLLLVLLSMLSFLGVAFWFGIYDRIETAGRRDVLRETARQVAVALTVIVVAQFLLHRDLSRAFLALFGALTLAALIVFRINAAPLLNWYRRSFGAQHYVMVVGSGESARRVGTLLEDSAHYGMRLTGFLDARPAVAAIELRREYPVHALSQLPVLLGMHVIDEIIFAVPTGELAALEETFLLCDEEGVRTRIAVDFFPHVNSDVYLDRLGSAPMITYSGAPHDEVRLLLKRSIDIVLSVIFIALLGLPMLLIMLVIRLTSAGPAIFTQMRCGLNGRRFTLYKFRSMVFDAEERKAALLEMNERKLVFKMRKDPRRTPFGRLLRKFSIDEWPQLWNVLKGDMSLVGPRPAIPAEVEQYKRWQRRRLRMRPGLTCLWAVEDRAGADFDKWMALDMQYIDNWSLSLDWKIIFRTIPQVVTGKGAH